LLTKSSDTWDIWGADIPSPESSGPSLLSDDESRFLDGFFNGVSTDHSRLGKETSHQMLSGNYLPRKSGVLDLERGPPDEDMEDATKSEKMPSSKHRGPRSDGELQQDEPLRFQIHSETRSPETSFKSFVYARAKLAKWKPVDGNILLAENARPKTKTDFVDVLGELSQGYIQDYATSTRRFWGENLVLLMVMDTNSTSNSAA